MGMRKVIVFLMIAILAFFSYTYLFERYNQNTAELYFNGILLQDGFERIKIHHKHNIFAANFIMPYQGNKLIMTTGLDFLTEGILMEKGEFISDIDRREAAIGDRAAMKYFRNGEVIGKCIDIFGKSYEIKGIIKNSNKIYISYDESLEELNWSKKVLKYNFTDDRQFYLEIDKLQKEFSASGIDVYDVVIIKEIIHKYSNLLIFIGVYVLFHFGIKLFKHIIKVISSISNLYVKKRKVIEIHEFLLCHIREVLCVIGWSLVILVIFYGIYALAVNLYISPSMMPENLFSPSSYMRVIKLYYEKFMLHIENGVIGILFDVHIIDLIFILLILAAASVSHGIKKYRSMHQILDINTNK